MKCPHCLVAFHPEQKFNYLGRDGEGYWCIEKYECPECKKLIFYLVVGESLNQGTAIPTTLDGITKRVLVRPKGTNRPPVPPEVPQEFVEDYTEACLVLPDSQKASAALSRRCLQHILREKAGVKPSNLADEIQEVLDGKSLPSFIADVVDAVRNIGNFAAHPIKSQQSGQIIEVEEGEAELNLDVLEALFDFYFVQPAKIAEKRKAIDQKLQDVGKPPMK